MYHHDHISYDRRKSIWDVDDKLLKYPEAKFDRDHNPLIEATIESWGHGCLENSAMPKDLKNFVDAFTKMFGLTPSKHLTAEDVIYPCMTRLDYHDPYYLLRDTKVQLTNDHFQYTYKIKATGETLEPTRIEVFSVMPDWDFIPYKEAEARLTHPAMKAFLRGEYIPDKFLNVTADRHMASQLARSEIIEKLISIVYGNMVHMDYEVEEDLNNFYEGLLSDYGSPEAYSDIKSSQESDYDYWKAACIAIYTWFKSPRAMPYLAQYHPVYGLLFDVADDGTVYEIKEAGGKVIVDGNDMYPISKLVEFKTAPPGTCEMCGTNLHCTKFLNFTALKHPTCSCGNPVDPRDKYLESHPHYNRMCAAYVKEHPVKPGYICQHCLFTHTHNLNPGTKCGRMTCPATSCRHHMGEAARIYALTEQRTKQLTAPIAR